VIESFWGRVQTELLNRQRWRTRIELANALFEYQEIFHNRRRRHSSLGMLTPRAHHQSPSSPGAVHLRIPRALRGIWSAMSQGDDPRLPAEDRMGRG
jgi:hypothetical protein